MAVRPISRAGTVTHLPLTLISRLLIGMRSSPVATMNRSESPGMSLSQTFIDSLFLGLPLPGHGGRAHNADITGLAEQFSAREKSIFVELDRMRFDFNDAVAS